MMALLAVPPRLLGARLRVFILAGNVMDTLKRLHENISALADGELADSELELALAALDSAEGRAAWQAYHLIGDTLRAQPPAAGLDDGCALRLAARLAAEAPLRAVAKARSPESDRALPDAAVTLP